MPLTEKHMCLPLTIGEVRSAAELRNRQQGKADIVCISEQKHSRYLIGFAASERALEEVQRLRFRVFNIELGEGLPESVLTGLDRDQYDDQMIHLMVVERATQEVVGTYRLQSIEHGLQHNGIYSAQEYDLSEIAPYFPNTVECGRACIAREHRSASVLLLMWAGLRDFVKISQLRWLIGCCSLTSQDPMDGWRALRSLKARGQMHSSFYLPVMPNFSCGQPPSEETLAAEPEYKLPKLFSAYMKLGAHVISAPAIDREFGTVDFLILMDAFHVNYSGLAQVTS